MNQSLSKGSPLFSAKQSPSWMLQHIQQQQQKKQDTEIKSNGNKNLNSQRRSTSPRVKNDGDISNGLNCGVSSLLKQIPSVGRIITTNNSNPKLHNGSAIINNQSSKQFISQKKTRTDSQEKGRISQQNLSSSNVGYSIKSMKNPYKNVNHNNTSLTPSQTSNNWIQFHKSFLQDSIIQDSAGHNSTTELTKNPSQQNIPLSNSNNTSSQQLQHLIPFQSSNGSSTSNRKIQKNNYKQDNNNASSFQEFVIKGTHDPYTLSPLSSENKISTPIHSQKQTKIVNSNGIGNNFNIQARGSGGGVLMAAYTQAQTSVEDSSRRQNSVSKQQLKELNQALSSDQRTPISKQEQKTNPNNSSVNASKFLSYEGNSSLSSALKPIEQLPISPLKLITQLNNGSLNNYPHGSQETLVSSNQDQPSSEASPLSIQPQTNQKQQNKSGSIIGNESLHDLQNDDNMPLNKERIQQLYMQQCWKKRMTILDRALKEEDSDEDEDAIQDEIKKKFKEGLKGGVNDIRNCQVNLKYKDQILHYELQTKDKNVEWLINYLLRRLYHHERVDLSHSDEQAREELKYLVTFQSSSNNMAVSYYLTQRSRLIEVFNKKCINITVLEFNDQSEYLSAPSQYHNITLSDFNLIRCVGMGGFSRVYLVQKKENGKMFALKLIDKKFILDNKKEGIVQNERNIMASIAHPFLLKLEYAFESNTFLGFIMEYCAGGELFYHLRRLERMNEDMARFYFVEICLGIDYLHKRHIIYRDIKPENILLDLDGHVRVGDFGLSKPDMDINDHAHSFCGSPEYMAPEMLLKVGHTYTVDFYCLGALLYELVTGLPPFYSHDTDEIYSRILYEELEFPNHVQMSPELRNLLQGLLTKHPQNRLGYKNGIRDILAHPWFKSIKIGDILEKLIPPPLKPNSLGFNFDEQEFHHGEKEFKKKLLNCQQGKDEEQLPTIFDDFYFDANLARLKKQKLLQRQQNKEQQQQQLQQQKFQNYQQQQLQQLPSNKQIPTKSSKYSSIKLETSLTPQYSTSNNQINPQFFISPNSTKNEYSNIPKNLSNTLSSSMKCLPSQKQQKQNQENPLQRKGSNQALKISAQMDSNISKVIKEQQQQINGNVNSDNRILNDTSNQQQLSSIPSNGNFKQSSDNFKMIGDNFKMFGDKLNTLVAAVSANQNGNNISSGAIGSNLNNNQLQQNRNTQNKQSTSLGKQQQSQQQQQQQLSSGRKGSSQLQLHLKANSAVKLQTNNYVAQQNQWGRQQQHQQVMIGMTNTSNAIGNGNTNDQSNISKFNLSNNKKMRTEEDTNYYEDEKGSNSQNNRILTDINRRSRALLKITTNGNGNMKNNNNNNNSLPKSNITPKNSQQYQLQIQQQSSKQKQQSHLTPNIRSSNNIMSSFLANQNNNSQASINNQNITNNSSSSNVNLPHKLLSNRHNQLPFSKEANELDLSAMQNTAAHTASISPAKNIQIQQKHYNPIDFINRNN